MGFLEGVEIGFRLEVDLESFSPYKSRFFYFRNVVGKNFDVGPAQEKR